MLQSNSSKFSPGKVSNPILVSCRESIMETKQSFYGKFYIGPLSVGQGLTLANALRRTLLSELVGLAITSVSIEGVSHEYSTLNGVRDSVLDILLNLKQIVLKSKQSLKRPQTAYLYFQGPGIVRACDLILPPTIQCVDPEQYIATLSSDGFLKMKLVIRQGKNYLVQTPNSFHVNNDKKERKDEVLDFSSFGSRNNPNVNGTEDEKEGTEDTKSLRLKSGSSSSSPKTKVLRGRESVLFEGQSPSFSSLNTRKNLNVKAKTLIPFFKYKVFLKLNNQKEKDSDSPRKLTKKKLNTLVFKNYRSLNNLFENSKNKELFLHLFKRQILSILAVKMSSRKVTEQNYGEGENGNLQLSISHSIPKMSSTFWMGGDPFSSMFFNSKTKTKALYLDAVFMPVTKVNYILEESRQKLLDSFDFFDSLNEINKNQQENTEFGEPIFDSDFVREKKKTSSSSDNLKVKRKKLPTKTHNATESKFVGDERSGSLNDSGLDESNFQAEGNSSSSTRHLETEQTSNSTNQTKTELALYFKKNWLNSKESWVLFSSEFNTSLFENFNQFPKDIIILEIWTNGSILPRTALKKAAQNLSNLFVKFENAKIMGNTFVETNKTYSQTIIQLYERYKKL